MVPPTVAESREARSTPYSKPAFAACARSRLIVTPAPAVTCAAMASTGSSRVSRVAESSTGPAPRPRGGGTEPPTSPVLPPCGTTAARCRAQHRITSATWAAEAGRTTQLAVPR